MPEKLTEMQSERALSVQSILSASPDHRKSEDPEGDPETSEEVIWEFDTSSLCWLLNLTHRGKRLLLAFSDVRITSFFGR